MAEHQLPKPIEPEGRLLSSGKNGIKRVMQTVLNAVPDTVVGIELVSTS